MVLVLLGSIFLFGLAVGSFLNVVVYRLNNGKNPLRGRSFCPKCKHQLAWYDNIPLLSFIFLKGKCRYCRSPISWQYPLVELVTGVLTLLIFNFQFSIFNFHLQGEICGNLGGVLYYLFIVYSLIAIFASDFLYMTIPDEISYPAIVVSFLYRLSGFRSLPENPFGHSGSALFLLAGLGAFLFFLFLYLLTRGKGMAFGDVKLALLLGLFLGWPKTIICLCLAFLTGALVGVILILGKFKKFGEPVPFGPFLVVGALISLFWGEKIVSIYLSSLGL